MNKWKVMISNKCAKQLKKLPRDVNLITQLLIEDLKEKGPYPGHHWPNYSKLSGKKQEDKRHCHLVKGRPTYVACWDVLDKYQLIEVYYVGTHEKAPY